MKKFCFLVIMTICCHINLFSQNYNNIVNYNTESTAIYGVKIKTNIPFEDMYSMPYIEIKGFDYGKELILSLKLILYVYDNSFYIARVSSSGGATPDVWLSNENGKISVFLDEKVYFQSFTISAFAKGQKSKCTDYQGWTVVDEPLGGISRTKAVYINNFAGKVGIGTETPYYELDVNGTIRAKEIKVESTGWADFVFDENYTLPTLEKVASHIKEHKHLPNIPSASEVAENGISIGEMNAKLLQKIEELTLYLIKQQEEINELKSQIKK